jgi:serine/threonine-protein kinase
MDASARIVDPAIWAKLGPLLDELLELDVTARSEKLGEWRVRDPRVAHELESLLETVRANAAERFLEDALLPPQPMVGPGSVCGAWTIEQLLGTGGMGSVWLAGRTDGRYQAKAAIKLPHASMRAHGSAERFEREGRLLARVSHPHIGALLDAGVAPSGQPYLVLEYVQGEPIDRYCDARRLDVAERIRLFADVVGAVAHAHSQLVLHRDLKPSNILVDAAGRVKLLDFGIAKLIEADPPATATAAAASTRVFTPDHVAPEQLEGEPVGTACDVYALGVLLYQLLAGSHPTAQPWHTPVQRLRAVIETAPVPMSEAVRAADAELCARRGTSQRQLWRALRGDLDTIAAKALKKSPAERYAGAAALAEDLKRWRDGEPLLARPDSAGYRLRLFVRRHKLSVGAAAATALALIAGVVGTTWQAVEAQRQRDRAQALLGRNEAIVNFVDMMFFEAVPAGQAAAVQQMLERSERLIARAFAGKPAQQAELLRVLATYYSAIQLPNKHAELLARAREIVDRVPDRSLKASLACAQAESLFQLGKGTEALAALEPWIDAPDIEPTVAATCLQARAVMAQNSLDVQGVLRYAEAALHRLRSSATSAPLLEATLSADIAFAHHLAGRNVEADRSYESALRQLRDIGRAGSAEAGRILADRGLVRFAMSDFKGGLELLQQVLDIFEARGDAQVPPSVLGNHAMGLETLGRWGEALSAYDRTFDASRRSGLIVGQAYALVGRAAVLTALGDTHKAQGSLDEAAALLKAAPATHPARARHLFVQGRVEAARGQWKTAGERFDELVELLESQGVSHRALVAAYVQRGEAALQLGNPTQSLADARKALDMARKLQGESRHSDSAGLANLTLGRALRKIGDASGARRALEVARAELLATLGADHPETRAASALLGAD